MEYIDPQKARQEQQHQEMQRRLERQRRERERLKQEQQQNDRLKRKSTPPKRSNGDAHGQSQHLPKISQVSFVNQVSAPQSAPVAPQAKPQQPLDREGRGWQGEKVLLPKGVVHDVPMPEPIPRAEYERRLKDGSLPPVFGRLLARLDHMEAHPDDLYGPLRVEPLMEPVTQAQQVASARVQRHGAKPETPVEQFQHRLKDGAIHRLEQNKARLTQVQGTYQNTQPSNEQWGTLRTLANHDQQLKRMQDQTNQELMALIAKKEFSNTPLGRLANQTPLGKMLDLPKSDPIQNGFLLNVLGVSPQDVDPKYREQFTDLRSRLELLHGARQEMRAVHPAIAVLDTAMVSIMANTEWNNSVMYRWMGEGFDGMRSDMSKLSKTVEQDPSKALLFDALVPQTLSSMKNPAERQQARQWAKQEQDKDAMLKSVLGVGSFGLTVGSALAGPLGWGVRAGQALLFGGAMLQVANATYEFPQVAVMDLAAKASVAGGDKLTNQTPEEARMNLAMGYANFVICGLDLGLQPGVIARVAQMPKAVRAAASLTRKQGQVLVNSIARHSGTLTDTALEKLLTAVRTADANTSVIIFNGDGTLTKMSPLEGVTQKLETTVAARASGKAKKPPKLFDEYLNAPRVKSFIGAKVDPNNLPPGYLYGKVPLENGKFREVIYMATSDGTKVPLKLDAKGLIKMADEGEYRIVNNGIYTKNIQTIPGKSGKLLGKDSQIHHLIPDNVMREQKIVQEALRRGIYNPDRTSNLIEMANKSISEETLNALKAKNPNAQLPNIRHYSGHADYDELVTELISQKIGQRNIRQMADNEILEVLETARQIYVVDYLEIVLSIESRYPQRIIV
jgi:hypothetical protein